MSDNLVYCSVKCCRQGENARQNRLVANFKTLAADKRAFRRRETARATDWWTKFASEPMPDKETPSMNSHILQETATP